MIKHSILEISDVLATSLDISETIKSSFTLVVQNVNSSGHIYIGNSSVSTNSYGFKLDAGQAFTIELAASQKMYAIASHSGLEVAVMEIDRAI